ncbi:MAG: helix-turn-helix domain-containing protein [Cryomorphaceae bacterium]|nr:helix-turn-helix domain-containing protein [Cryomorphaceae bacterium]
MSYFASNLKYLRSQKKLTQAQLAEVLGLNRPVIGAYEESRSEPKISTLLHMAGYFNVSLDDFLGMNLVERGDRTASGLQVLPISVDRESGEERITLVPVKAVAGYNTSFGDLEYIGSLPHFDLPIKELSRNYTYRMFQVEGESMLPVLPGSYVLGSYESDHRNVGGGNLYVVVTTEGVVFKRVERDLERGVYRLVSENPQYLPYEVEVGDVKEFWRVRGYFGFEFPGGWGYRQLEEILSILRSK